MNLFWNKTKLYLSLPEMRMFWVILPIAITIAVLNFAFSNAFWGVFILGLLAILVALVFFTNLRFARTNLQIKVERNQLQSIITTLRDGVVAYDSDFRVLVFNRAAEAIFGVREEEVRGKPLTPSQVQDERYQVLIQTIFPSLAPVAVSRSESGQYPQITDLSFDDPKLDLRVITARITDPGGTLLGFMKLVQDRSRELGLIRSKSEFITVAAHQLRTPLTAVIWSFEAAMKEEGLTQGTRAMIETGHKASKKMLDVVNDLLDVSKIEEGKFGYQFEQADFIAFVEKILSEASLIAQEYSVKIYFDRPQMPLPQLTIDSAKMSLALSNLLDNAIKYNVKNGEVVVKIELVSEKPFVQVSVKDTGVGVPSGQVNNLFKKFFRAENTMRTETEGSGLGLYIVKNIVMRHGGRVWAESAENRGTTIFFTLPTDSKLIPPKEVVYEES